jgi:uncharacterized membrane protein
MSSFSRLSAVVVYLLPIVGWLYGFLFQRKDPFVMFHLKQAIGLFAFLIAALVVWALVAWVLFWLPYFAVVGMALFAIVIAAFLYGLLAWIMGMINALNNRLSPLPIFGQWANRLPIQ